MFQTEVLSVTEQPQKVSRRVTTGDDHDVLDTGVDQRLDRVVDHRLVMHRQEMLIRDFRQREESRSESARQNNSFHCLDRLPTAVQNDVSLNLISSRPDRSI